MFTIVLLHTDLQVISEHIWHVCYELSMYIINEKLNLCNDVTDKYNIFE